MIQKLEGLSFLARQGHPIILVTSTENFSDKVSFSDFQHVSGTFDGIFEINRTRRSENLREHAVKPIQESLGPCCNFEISLKIFPSRILPFSDTAITVDYPTKKGGKMLLWNIYLTQTSALVWMEATYEKKIIKTFGAKL